MNENYGLLVVLFVALFFGFVFMDLICLIIALVLQIMYFGFSRGDLIGEFIKFYEAMPLLFLLVGSFYAFVGLAFYLPYIFRIENAEYRESRNGYFMLMNLGIFGITLSVLYSGFSKNDLKGELLKFLNILPTLLLAFIVLCLVFGLLLAIVYYKISKSNKKN